MKFPSTATAPIAYYRWLFCQTPGKQQQFPKTASRIIAGLTWINSTDPILSESGDVHLRRIISLGIRFRIRGRGQDTDPKSA